MHIIPLVIVLAGLLFVPFSYAAQHGLVVGINEYALHKPDLKGAVKELMKDESGEEWLDSEVTTLEKMIEDVAGPLSADGGYIVSDVYGNLPTLGWSNLTRTFLKT